jgi:hypothetical protein
MGHVMRSFVQRGENVYVIRGGTPGGELPEVTATKVISPADLRQITTGGTTVAADQKIPPPRPATSLRLRQAFSLSLPHRRRRPDLP